MHFPSVREGLRPNTRIGAVECCAWAERPVAAVVAFFKSIEKSSAIDVKQGNERDGPIFFFLQRSSAKIGVGCVSFENTRRKSRRLFLVANNKKKTKKERTQTIRNR
jgi:hypothetical protein